MRLSWIVALVSLASTVLARSSGGGPPDPPPPGTVTLDHRGKRLSVTVSGADVLSSHTPTLVSGTSVEFGVHAGAGLIPQGTPGYDPSAIDNWRGVKIIMELFRALAPHSRGTTCHRNGSAIRT